MDGLFDISMDGLSQRVQRTKINSQEAANTTDHRTPLPNTTINKESAALEPMPVVEPTTVAPANTISIKTTDNQVPHAHVQGSSATAIEPMSSFNTTTTTTTNQEATTTSRRAMLLCTSDRKMATTSRQEMIPRKTATTTARRSGKRERSNSEDTATHTTLPIRKKRQKQFDRAQQDSTGTIRSLSLTQNSGTINYRPTPYSREIWIWFH